MPLITLGEDSAYRYRAQQNTFNRLSGFIRVRQAVVFTKGVEVLFHLLIWKIDDPVFGDAGAGVELFLYSAVFFQGGIRHFDDQLNVLRARMVASA